MLIVTDTASDILQSEAEASDIIIIPLEIRFGTETFLYNTHESLDHFYDLLVTLKDEFPTTSGPSPQTYLKLIDQARDAGEEILIITISSGLSGTYETACMAAEMSGYDKVRVVDSLSAIIPQHVIVDAAVRMRDEGMSVDQAADELEELRTRVKVFGMPDSLTYLKRGGRIPASVAALGNLLNIKPIIAVADGGGLECIAKARGRKAGKALLWKHLEETKIDPEYPLYFGYSEAPDIVDEFIEETYERFGWQGRPYKMDQINGAVGAHLGPHCIAISYVEAK